MKLSEMSDATGVMVEVLGMLGRLGLTTERAHEELRLLTLYAIRLRGGDLESNAPQTINGVGELLTAAAILCTTAERQLPLHGEPATHHRLLLEFKRLAEELTQPATASA